MREKPSLQRAREEALQLSKKYPKMEYYIIDKKGGKPRVFSEIIYGHKTFIDSFFEEGYITVEKYTGGQEVPLEEKKDDIN